MLDIFGNVYRFAKLLRVICAGFQVADAVMNLSKMVNKLDDLEQEMQRLSENLIGEAQHGAESITPSSTRAGGV